jgi:hypothetical protein
MEISQREALLILLFNVWFRREVGEEDNLFQQIVHQSSNL